MHLTRVRMRFWAGVLGGAVPFSLVRMWLLERYTGGGAWSASWGWARFRRCTASPMLRSCGVAGVGGIPGVAADSRWAVWVGGPAAEPLTARGSAGVAGGWVASCKTDAAQSKKWAFHGRLESQVCLCCGLQAIEHARACGQVLVGEAAKAAASPAPA